VDPLISVLIAGAIVLVSLVQLLLVWILSLLWREIVALRLRVDELATRQAEHAQLLRSIAAPPRG